MLCIQNLFGLAYSYLKHRVCLYLSRTLRASRLATVCTSCRETKSLAVRRKAILWRRVMGTHTHTHPQLYELFDRYELLLSAISSVMQYNCVVGWGRCGRGGSAQLKEEFSPSLMLLWVTQTHVIYSVHYKQYHPIISLINRGLTFTMKRLHQLSELLLNVSITTQTSCCPYLRAHWENEQLSVVHFIKFTILLLHSIVFIHFM